MLGDGLGVTARAGHDLDIGLPAVAKVDMVRPYGVADDAFSFYVRCVQSVVHVNPTPFFFFYFFFGWLSYGCWMSHKCGASLSVSAVSLQIVRTAILASRIREATSSWPGMVFLYRSTSWVLGLLSKSSHGTCMDSSTAITSCPSDGSCFGVSVGSDGIFAGPWTLGWKRIGGCGDLAPESLDALE
jgi:hypothetical protein